MKSTLALEVAKALEVPTAVKVANGFAYLFFYEIDNNYEAYTIFYFFLKIVNDLVLMENKISSLIEKFIINNLLENDFTKYIEFNIILLFELCIIFDHFFQQIYIYSG